MKGVIQEKVKEDWVDKKLSHPKSQVFALDTPMQVDQAPSSSSPDSGHHSRGKVKGQGK